MLANAAEGKGGTGETIPHANLPLVVSNSVGRVARPYGFELRFSVE
jgi:hypothetical protein